MDVTLVFWNLSPLLLVLVALHQRWRIAAVGQSAWKGGGFGMFSDIHRNHFIAVVWVADPAGTLIQLRVDAKGFGNRPAFVPTKKNAIQWAREIASGHWERVADTARPRSPHSASQELILLRVSVHHVQVDFDAVRGIYTSIEKGRHILLVGEQQAA